MRYFYIWQNSKEKKDIKKFRAVVSFSEVTKGYKIRRRERRFYREWEVLPLEWVEGT